RRRRAARRRPDPARPARAAETGGDERRQPDRSCLMRPARVLASALAVIALLAFSIPSVVAQSSREAERKLDRIKRELKDVAAERRQIEGRRSDASRELRSADEQLGHSSRALSETRQQLAQQQASLLALQQRRATMETDLAAHRRADRATTWAGSRRAADRAGAQPPGCRAGRAARRDGATRARSQGARA